jgi:transcriptional regulator of acetoin/glycerol metabolism
MTPADLRKLSEYAERGGADAAWLQRVIGELLEEHLALDPRRIASIERARAVRHAVAAGATVGQACGRFGLSRATYYRKVSQLRETDSR